MDEYIAKYEKASCCKRPRDLHLEKPARTLTFRNLAGATGDMHRIRLPDGIGNAVAPLFGFYIAGAVRNYWEYIAILSDNFMM